MKKLIIALFCPLLLTGCGDGTEKKASERLNLARESFAAGNLSEAKLHIDSIKILYPKAFGARKEGIRLRQQVETKEQNLLIARLDSALARKAEELEAAKSKFILEKDEEYQDIGNYFWPTQTVEKNLHRSYLRFQVSERGEMAMTSIYCGARNINHNSVKVSAPDGSFAETPSSRDSYQTTDLGEKIEKADYKLGEDGSVMDFLYLNHDKNIRIEFIGDRKHAITMSADDKKALVGIYELTKILHSIEQLKKEHKEANLKLEFVQRNIERNQKDSIS